MQTPGRVTPMRVLFVSTILALCLTILASPIAAQDVRSRAQASLVLRSAVAFEGRRPDDGEWVKFCSGVAISETVIMTAAHCLVGKEEMVLRVITISEQVATVSERILYRKRDIAFVKVVTASGAPLGVRPTSAASDVSVGDTIMVAGAPNGVELMITRGIVGRIDVDAAFTNKGVVPERQDIGTEKQQVLWIDALTYSGSSGAGVYNENGQLVGMVVRLAGAGNPASPTWLWAFAIGINSIREVLR